MRNPKLVIPLSFLLIVLAVATLPAQVDSRFVMFGVKGGALATLPGPYSWSTAQNRGTWADQSTRLTVGPMVEFRLPLRFSVEANALFKRSSSHFDVTQISSDGVEQPSSWQSTVNSWDFPFLLKHYLPVGGGAIRPYLAGGYSLNRSENGNLSRLTHGATVGGGLQFRMGPLRLAPEFRFTRWRDPLLGRIGPNPDTSRNQPEFLVGITF